jgi:hypothetical protein
VLLAEITAQDRMADAVGHSTRVVARSEHFVFDSHFAV